MKFPLLLNIYFPILFVQIHTQSFTKEESDAKVALEEAEKTLQTFLTNLRTSQWAHALNTKDEDVKLKMDAAMGEYLIAYDIVVRDLATKFPNWRQYDDTFIKAWMRSYLTASPDQMADTKDEYMKIEKLLKNNFKQQTLCQFGNEGKNCVLSVEDFEKEMRLVVDDVNLMIYNWEHPRDKLGNKEAINAFKSRVDLWQKASQLQGLKSAFELWTNHFFYDFETVLDDVNSLWQTTKPIYEEFLTYVNHHWRLKYGKQFSVKHGLAQSEFYGFWGLDFSLWPKLMNPLNSSTSRPIFNLEDQMRNNELTPAILAKKADELITSMGFDDLSVEFWEKSFFENNAEGVRNCASNNIYDFQDGEKTFYAGGCGELTMESSEMIFGLIGTAHYYNVMKELPSQLQSVTDKAWNSFIPRAVGLNLLSPVYLQQIGILPSGISNMDETMVYYVFQKCFHLIPAIHHGIALELWYWGVLNGEINNENYQNTWIKNTANYQLLRPPHPRKNMGLDSLSKKEIAIDTDYKWAFGPVVQFNIFKKMCESLGHTGPLYRCNLYGKATAGQVLKNIMQHGLSKSYKETFQDVLEIGIFDGNAILDYCAPMIEIVKKYNSDNKLEKVFWNGDESDLLSP